ncbi:MAG: DUF4373 domain-containing protein [Clostridia bacterium]|nr:DUF4373 domain-containing protein [Clostridia bacterium]
MARPRKTGLDFYYKGVYDMDDFRLIELMEKYGAVGYVVLDITTSCVYRNGYYLEMPVNRLASYIYRYLVGNCAYTSSDIAEMIRYCGELGFFDSELLSQSVITSREIQEHYSCVTARRKSDRSKYWLLPEKPEMTVNAAETTENAAEMQQRKVNKSKSKSKEKQTKPNESKAKAKAEQSKRAGAEELFPEKEEAAAAADAAEECGELSADAADAAAAACHANTGGYAAIEKAYLDATGRFLAVSDRDDIDRIRKEGADDRLILSAIDRAASRRNGVKINSFRYFLPMIRELLSDGADRPPSGRKDGRGRDDGFIHSDAGMEDLYPGCLSEEDIIRAMEREWGHEPGWNSEPVDYSD